MTRERPAAGDGKQDSTDKGFFPQNGDQRTRDSPIATANRGWIKYNGLTPEDPLSGTYVIPGGLSVNRVTSETTDTYGTASITATLSPGILIADDGEDMFNVVADGPGTTTTFTLAMKLNNMSPIPDRQYWYSVRQDDPIRGPIDTLFPVVTHQISMSTGDFRQRGLQWGDIAGCEKVINGIYTGYIALPTVSPSNLQFSAYLQNISTSFTQLTLSVLFGEIPSQIEI